ncbi:hypothetical protein [Sporomusa termitida]|uniref:hypothetical protein n=1 Tax=Sporomusa termitida TaxID=2377 RepID=UPI001478A816|nr:hypothetical protein [Sporomusa termitida]
MGILVKKIIRITRMVYWLFWAPAGQPPAMRRYGPVILRFARIPPVWCGAIYYAVLICETIPVTWHTIGFEGGTML